MRPFARVLPLLFAPLLFAPLLPAQDPPRTVPEASDFAATSRVADVERFLDACTRLSAGNRLELRVAGKTTEGRALTVVKIAAPERPTAERVRALVIGNIHAGEVEGKEALQQLVREFATGEHADVLARCELWLLPVYNADGNEAVGPKNREGQNGPDVVGKRANGAGLDLNRDFVKAEAPETTTLLQLFREVDPHLFMDLHTTNGSYHGYHLTYAPSLSPNVDRDVARLTRTLLDLATAAMQKDGFAAFDYGNFETRDWDGGGAPESAAGVRGWYTYDHRARYGVNYFGLRNRIGILSEAYSYADFRTRIAATRSFVLGTLRHLGARADEVLATTSAADRRLAAAEPVHFGFDTGFAPPERLPILVDSVDVVPGSEQTPTRYLRAGRSTPETMPVVRAFTARSQRALPTAWAIVAPSPEVEAKLRAHGIEFSALTQARRATAQRFAIGAKKKPKRPFQGHQELVLTGTWQPAAPTDLPPGTLLIPATQRLGRLAATLLEPESEDSLSTWNFFEAATGEHYPVLRVQPD